MYLMLRFTPDFDFDEFHEFLLSKNYKYFIVKHSKGKTERLHYHGLIEIDDIESD